MKQICKFCFTDLTDPEKHTCDSYQYFDRQLDYIELAEGEHVRTVRLSAGLLIDLFQHGNMLHLLVDKGVPTGTEVIRITTRYADNNVHLIVKGRFEDDRKEGDLLDILVTNIKS